MQQAGVLSPGAEARGGRVGAFDDRSRIDVAARPHRAESGFDPLGELVQHLRHHVVVVVAPRVARDPAPVFGDVGRVGLCGVVLEADDYERASPGESRTHVGAPIHLVRQVAHLSGVALLHPAGEEVEVIGPIDGSDPDDVEACLPGEPLDDLRLGFGHAPLARRRGVRPRRRSRRSSRFHPSMPLGVSRIAGPAREAPVANDSSERLPADRAGADSLMPVGATPKLSFGIVEMEGLNPL